MLSKPSAAACIFGLDAKPGVPLCAGILASVLAVVPAIARGLGHWEGLHTFSKIDHAQLRKVLKWPDPELPLHGYYVIRYHTKMY
jgi:hypothetical protein